MSQHDDFDRSLARWLDAEAHPAATAEVLDRALSATHRRRPRPRLFATLGSRWVGDGGDATSGALTLGRTGPRASMAVLLLLLVLALVAGAVMVGARLRQPALVDLGIFEPISGWVVYGGGGGIWGDNPDGPDIKLAAGAGTPLGWSSDGTRLLIMRGSFRWGSRGEQHLFVLRADGSETQVTMRPMAIRGATISPDGSRVVFAGGTEDPDGECCTAFALYAVDVDGGPVEKLVEARNGILEEPTFSPDGTRIAYNDGTGDNNHHVWVMDADGSDAHEILSQDCACHVQGLAWSPAGDRIALGLEGTIYTFATDGSGFTQVRPGGTTGIFWSPDGSQIETTGPWHPGKLHVAPSPSVETTSVPSPSVEPASVPSVAAPDGRSALWLVQPDGAGPRKLLDGTQDGDWQWLLPNS